MLTALLLQLFLKMNENLKEYNLKMMTTRAITLLMLKLLLLVHLNLTLDGLIQKMEVCKSFLNEILLWDTIEGAVSQNIPKFRHKKLAAELSEMYK